MSEYDEGDLVNAVEGLLENCLDWDGESEYVDTRKADLDALLAAYQAISPPIWTITNSESVLVHSPGTWENDTGPADWYAISDDQGIKAYAATDEIAAQIQRAAWAEGRMQEALRIAEVS